MLKNKNVHGVYVNLGASNHANIERAKNDFYATPPIAVKELLKVEHFNKNIWEPCCGMMHIVNELEAAGYNVKASDILKYTDRDVELINFLEYNGKFNGDIVSNPPYKYAQAFVEKSLECLEEGCKVAMFLRLQFLEGKKRFKLFKNNPPKVVYIASSRLECSATGKWVNEGQGGAVCFAWYIWEKDFKGDPIIKWINVKEE